MLAGYLFLDPLLECQAVVDLLWVAAVVMKGRVDLAPRQMGQRRRQGLDIPGAGPKKADHLPDVNPAPCQGRAPPGGAVREDDARAPPLAQALLDQGGGHPARGPVQASAESPDLPEGRIRKAYGVC